MTPALPDALNLADYFLFDRIAEGRGDRVAIRFGDRRWTYAEVADRSRRAITVLRDLGLRPEERVYIVLPDTPPFAWAFFGVLGAGGVVAMGNPLTKTDSLVEVIDYVRPRVVITTGSVAGRLADAWRDAGIDTTPPALLVVPDGGTFDDPEAALEGRFAGADFGQRLAKADAGEVTITGRDAPAIWLFTSGSTGRPKAAMHCHRDFAFNTEVYAKGTIGYAEDDICVSVPRLFFGYATGTNLMFPFAVGASCGLFVEKPTAERIAWAVDHYRATALTNVPTLMSRLLEADAAEGSPALDLSSLKWMLSAGEALPPALLDRWSRRWDVPVYDGIGSAEMFHIYITNRPGDVKPGSLGRVVDGYAARVLPADAEGPGAEPAAQGEDGVLWIKGDSVALGYWLDRDKSWRTFHGHWCRTGDLFRVDDAGYFWFRGRADQLLKVSGQWVSPLEIEHCLAEHADVVEAAVIGVQRDGLMSTRAFVETRGAPADGLAETLQGWVRTRLARYKYPREVVFVDRLPRNDRGKVDKKRLPRD